MVYVSVCTEMEFWFVGWLPSLLSSPTPLSLSFLATLVLMVFVLPLPFPSDNRSVRSAALDECDLLAAAAGRCFPLPLRERPRAVCFVRA